MADTISVQEGQVIWSGNGVRLADSVIQREANFSLDRALANIYYSEASIRGTVLAYLSIFPLLIKKAEGDGQGVGPTMEVLCAGHNVHCDGHVLWLRSDMPITVGVQPGKEELVSFVLATPDRLIVRRGSVYLNIKLVPPPDCANCELA